MTLPQSKIDATYMQLAQLEAGTRANCARAHVGAVIVSHRGQIAAQGANGSTGVTCSNFGNCHNTKGRPTSADCTAQHAEALALTALENRNWDVAGLTLYVTTEPCAACSKLILDMGLFHRVVYLRSAPRSDTKKLLVNGIDVEQFQDTHRLDDPTVAMLKASHKDIIAAYGCYPISDGGNPQPVNGLTLRSVLKRIEIMVEQHGGGAVEEWDWKDG